MTQIVGYDLYVKDDITGDLTGYSFNIDGQLDANRTADPSALNETISITINPVDDAPYVTGTLAALDSGEEDAGYHIPAADLTSNITDVDGDSLNVLNLSLVDSSQGSFSQHQDGDWHFYPAADFNGTVDFTYQVQDSAGSFVQDSSGNPASLTASFELEAVDDSPFRITPEGGLSDLIADEDSGLISFGLNALDYSPGVGEDDQTLTYTITATPDSAIGTLGYLDADNNNAFVEVFGGDTLTLDQLRSLSLQTAQDGFGDSDFSFSVSDDGSGSGGSVIWTLYGDQAIAQAETTTLQDLNADGIVGVNVTNTLFNPYNPHTNGGVTSNLSRYVYETTGGLLISRTMLESSDGSGGATAGGYTDLRNVSRTNDSWSGPSVVLIDRDDLGLSDQDELAGARLLQTTTAMGGTRASGYELIVKLWDEQHASIVGIESVIFELDGSIRERETFTSTAAINAKEVELRVDLNNNAVVGANIQDVLYDPADYGEMAGIDSRSLYQSSYGIILSNEILTLGNDLRSAMSGDDPDTTIVLLRTDGGDSAYSIPADYSTIRAVAANRDLTSNDHRLLHWL